MWGDRLLPPSTGYNMWERRKNETETAIALMPYDIVMCDWHYEAMEQNDYPSVRYFQEKGFRVRPAGWNKPQAVRGLMAVARRDAGKKMLGYPATTWLPVREVVPALAGQSVPSDSEQLPKVVECVRLGAEMARD